MESKRSKKGRKSRPAESEHPSNQQQEQHHPWDEDPSAKSPQANRAIPSTGTALTRFLTCMAPVIVAKVDPFEVEEEQEKEEHQSAAEEAVYPSHFSRISISISRFAIREQRQSFNVSDKFAADGAATTFS
ncbi:GM25066 [Drosophila sechellia]|uniref:GM25066 n=1 Tax=Drosophila sechellia TaxID=7238 RepID=B4HJZ4_DROSE|nr:GM25066 [Drosophila sechellia]